MEVIKRESHIVDAENRSLGKLAASIAVLLRGKQKQGFFPYKDMGDFVVVKNIDKIKFSGKKFENKIYYHHTLHLGGLKSITMKELQEKKGPEEIIKKAVMGMLPKNKLRARQIKRLKFER